MIQEEYFLKPAYILINNKVRLTLPNGVKMNHFSDDFTIIMPYFSDTFDYIYVKAVKFDIIGYDNDSSLILLHNCVLMKNDITVNYGQKISGKFLICKILEEEDWQKNSILQNLRKRVGGFFKNK